MAPFRWPTVKHDIMLATEVASRNPTTPQDWEEIASILSRQFSTPEKHHTERMGVSRKNKRTTGKIHPR